MSLGKSYFYILIALLLGFFVWQWGPQQRSCSFLSMGGIETEVRGYYTNRNDFNAACMEIKSFFEDMENEISNYRLGSSLSKMNHDHKKTKVELPERTFALLKESLKISDETGGYFDITVLPLVDLWKKSEKTNHLPQKDEIQKILKKISYKKIRILDEKKRLIEFLNPEMELDFGAIGKGYMGDVAVQIMQKHQISRGMVNCGGGVVGYDNSSNPKPFRVRIYNPDLKSPDDAFVLILNESVQTSGDYNRFRKIQDKKYSHIINPHTGYPEGSCHSITIKAKTGAIADGFSTGYCSMVAAGLDPSNYPVKDVEIVQLKRD